ncbi:MULTISPECIES: GTP-binding protein [Streptomyces]|uniref:GTP-binding protein n=1 Tax=Streptomyces TaxID=1883 RepID=UPI0005B7D67C|nr:MULTISPECIES: GTP-binding protein [Streptomyces]MDP9953264.1 bifunctional enzyme CysN/CysC/sulfate adenylyltransferase subunit 1 [Streptomyces sp. DSM 41269]
MTTPPTLSSPPAPSVGPPAGPVDADTLHVAFVGEVDHGKSTLLGRVLHDTGAITADRLGARIEDGGLAFLLDGLSEERADLFTLDTAQAVLETEARRYVLIDVPGHLALLKNMATGASRAELGVVVVDCLVRGTDQTRRHLRVLELLGVTNVVCAVTKMDLVGYAEEDFRRVADEMAALVEACGLRLSATVPVSAVAGHNITAPAPDRLPWYTGQPLLDTLHGIGQERARSALLRFAVQAVVGPPGARRIAGRTESGTLRPGQTLTGTDGERCVVRTIERFGEAALEKAEPGDSVGLLFDGAEPAPGTVLAPPDQPLTTGRVWHIRILSTSDTKTLAEGDRCVVRYAAGSAPAYVERIDSRWNSSTLARLTEDGPVRFTEFADLRLRLDTAAPADRVRDCVQLGRFMLCDEDGRALALGVVDRVEDTEAREPDVRNTKQGKGTP